MDPTRQPDDQRPAEDCVDHLERAAARIELLARHRRPGRARDQMMGRHVADVLRPFHSRWLRVQQQVTRVALDDGRRWPGRSARRRGRRRAPVPVGQ